MVDDKTYPQRLLHIKDFPKELYAVGNITLLNAKYTIGIVGSRNCTEYGRRVANEFAKKLSEKEICVVSGMAIGIDGIAHNAAIETLGKTIAVLGGGFHHIFPPENEWLFYKILEKGGCIISEYAPEVEPDKDNFPIRNRIISGLSDAVLVVEAVHRSGSTITAKQAKAEGKLVYAIPNNIYITTGVGTNRLIQEGAILVTKPETIIDGIKYKKEMAEDNKLAVKNRKREEQNEENNSKIQTEEKEEKIEQEKKRIIPEEYLPIYTVLSKEPVHINEISKILKRPVQEINSILTMMEIEDFAYQPQTNYFVRNSSNH